MKGAGIQLDIFDDSVETMLLNDVVRALRQLSFQGAEKAITELSIKYPGNAGISSAQALMDIREFPGEIACHQGLDKAVGRIVECFQPASESLLGSDAKQWLRQHAWGKLALMVSDIPYSNAYPSAHAAAVWIRAEEWGSAIQSILSIPGWRKLPVPLHWMVIAKIRSGAINGTWPLLMELAWMAPETFAETVRSMRNQALLRLMDDFEASFEDSDDCQLCWFPALAITASPVLMDLLRGVEPVKVTEATRAFDCVRNLLILEKQGRQSEIAKERALLRSLNGALFKRYMRSR